MKKVRKWQMGVSAAAVLLLLLLAAMLSPNREEKTTLELGVFAGSNWNVANADGHLIIDKAISKFEETHPGVKVHYYSGIPKNDYSEWLSRKMLKGELPDVFMVLSNDFDKLVSLGMLENLDNRIAKDGQFNTDRYFPTALSYGERENHQYALPYETVPTLMFVNKTLLNKEGFSVPEYDWTWEHLERICERITRDLDGDGKIDQFGTYNYNWTDALYSNGGVLFDESGSKSYLDDDVTVEAVKFVEGLNRFNDGDRATQEDFDSGNVAFMPLSFAEYRTYRSYPYKLKKYSNFQWECITFPAGPNGSNISEVDSLLLGISSKSRHKQLAWEFLKTLTYDEEIQLEIFKYSQGASVLKDVTGSDEAEKILQRDTEEGDKIIDNHLLSSVIEEGMVTPRFAEYEDALALAEGEVLKIYENEKNVESSLRIGQITLEHFLSQY